MQNKMPIRPEITFPTVQQKFPYEASENRCEPKSDIRCIEKHLAVWLSTLAVRLLEGSSLKDLPMLTSIVFGSSRSQTRK